MWSLCRQKKYLLQNWNLFNQFSFPEVHDNWECSICYDCNKESIDSQSILTFECNHSFCKNCLNTMLITKSCPSKDLCPYCRKEIDVKINIKNKVIKI